MTESSAGRHTSCRTRADGWQVCLADLLAERYGPMQRPAPPRPRRTRRGDWGDTLLDQARRRRDLCIALDSRAEATYRRRAEEVA